MSGGWLVEIVVLAMIAGFVALRLVSVLGRRTGHEQPLPQTLDRSASDGMSRQPGGAETQGPASIVPDSNIDSKAVEGIRAIIAADPSFDVSRFLEGSKAAYRMVLEAFWAGDAATLETLADDSVTREFTAAIDERKAQGLTLDGKPEGDEKGIRRHASAQHASEQHVARKTEDAAHQRQPADRAGCAQQVHRVAAPQCLIADGAGSGVADLTFAAVRLRQNATATNLTRCA